jgi:hypothetical protein
MASQRLFDRFEIITRISSGILQVYLAREKSTGNDALVREFPVDGAGWKAEEIADRAKKRLDELEPGIDLTHFADADVSADGHRAWVVVWAVKDASVSADAGSPTQAPVAEPALQPAAPVFPAAPPAAGEPGEFTKMFAPPKPAARHIQTAEPISLAGGNAPPPQAIRNAPPPQAKPMEEGEFTRMFGAPVSATPATPNVSEPAKAVPPSAPPSAPPAAPSGAATNIFDVMSQKGVQKSTPPANPFPDAPKSDDAGSTMVFGAMPRSPVVEQKVVSRDPAAPPANKEAVGEFTRMFGGAPTTPVGEPHASGKATPVDPFEAAIAKSSANETPGLYTQLFSGVKLSGPDPALKGPAHPAKPAPPAAPVTPFEAPKSGPGEFTQMFQKAKLPTNMPPTTSSPFGDAYGDAAPGELTQLFTMKTPSAHEPVSDPFAAFGTPTAAPSGSPESLTQILSHTPATPVTQPPVAPPPIAAQPVGGGATHIFSQPQPVAPSAPPSPAGPGEYTRIIGAPTMTPPAAAATPSSTAPAGGGIQGAMPQVSGPQVSGPQFSGPQFSGPQFSGASVTPPSMMAPSMTAPSVQGPYVQAPQVSTPTFQAPSPSAPSAAPAEKKGLGAYMPLIIILNVLVILAIILVAYFALKHH